MVSLGVKSLQDENFGIERPFGVRLQFHQLVAIIQRLEKDVSINSKGLDSEKSKVDISFTPMIIYFKIFISKSLAKLFREISLGRKSRERLIPKKTRPKQLEYSYVPKILE
jgi:hypothetical protein